MIYFVCLKGILILICYFQEIERVAIRNRVLEEQRAKIQKYFKFEVVNFEHFFQENETLLNRFFESSLV